MFSTAFLDVPALQGASGTVTLPGSKSISNRVLLLSALCQGTTVVHDLLDSDDTRVMLAALRQLGCGVDVQGATVTITGLGGQLKHHDAIEFFMGNAGTAMRPLTAALAVLGGDFTLKGVPRMHERPIGDLVDALRLLGCSIDYLGNDGFPPLHIGQPSLKVDAPIQVRGDVSSQFLTALLMALPLAAKTQDIVIEVVGELISKPYIDITLNLLARYGIAVKRDGWQRFTIPQGCSYQSPGTIHVEADASSASYFIALGAIAEGDGIRIQGVGADSIQGDIRFMDAAAQMGAKITSGPNWLEINRGSWPLKGITLDCNHIPDAAMTLAVMALYADGPTTLRNIASWRVKETDRIVAMATECRKLGATVEEGPDWITVHPLPKDGWKAASIHTYDDHRVAMCFSLAAFNADQVPVRIEDPKCVAKTFPDYFEALFSVAHADTQHIPVICIDGPTASGKGTLASSSSNITLTSNVMSLSTTSVTTSGTVTVQPYGNSFTSALSWPLTNLTLSNSVTGLTIGKSTNTANVTLGSATNIAGFVTIYGGTVALNAALTGTNINVTGNSITEASGIAVTSTGGNNIIDNVFEGNLTQVAYGGHGDNNNSPKNVWRGNYWDDYQGFDRNGDGIGDRTHELYSYADQIWMELPIARFFRSSPVMELLMVCSTFISSRPTPPVTCPIR